MYTHAPSEFKYTTLTLFPESRREDGTWTPKRVGVTLLDEGPEFTGIYIRDEAGGLWPARTVAHTPASHHRNVCAAWLSAPGENEDKRTVGVEDELLARWETKGKDWIELFASLSTKYGNVYHYRMTKGGGNLPLSVKTDEAAISFMSNSWGHEDGTGACTVLRSDRPSLHRVK